jgi:hypothetical protein
MSSIRTDAVAFDTNVYIHGLRRSPGQEACSELMFGFVATLRLYLPIQVQIELRRNLSAQHIRDLFAVLRDVQTIEWAAEAASEELVESYRSRGAKKGDADIAAQLDVAEIRWLVSENRHFLSEIADLPFRVITAAEALAILRSEE